ASWRVEVRSLPSCPTRDDPVPVDSAWDAGFSRRNCLDTASTLPRPSGRRAHRCSLARGAVLSGGVVAPFFNELHSTTLGMLFVAPSRASTRNAEGEECTSIELARCRRSSTPCP